MRKWKPLEIEDKFCWSKDGVAPAAVDFVEYSDHTAKLREIIDELKWLLEARKTAPPDFLKNSLQEMVERMEGEMG